MTPGNEWYLEDARFRNVAHNSDGCSTPSSRVINGSSLQKITNSMKRKIEEPKCAGHRRSDLCPVAGKRDRILKHCMMII